MSESLAFDVFRPPGSSCVSVVQAVDLLSKYCVGCWLVRYTVYALYPSWLRVKFASTVLSLSVSGATHSGG